MNTGFNSSHFGAPMASVPMASANMQQGTRDIQTNLWDSGRYAAAGPASQRGPYATGHPFHNNETFGFNHGPNLDHLPPFRPVARESQVWLPRIDQVLGEWAPSRQNESCPYQDSGHSYETAIVIDDDVDEKPSVPVSILEGHANQPRSRDMRTDIEHELPPNPNAVHAPVDARSPWMADTHILFVQDSLISRNGNPSDRVPSPPTNKQSHPASERPALTPQVQNPQEEDIAQLAKMPQDAITEPVREVFDPEQCDKILWLALHGVPYNAIARLMHSSVHVPRRRGSSLEAHLSDLERVVRHFTSERVSGKDGHESPHQLISRLLEVGDKLQWSPYLFKQAVEYSNMCKEADNANARKHLRDRAAELGALGKWRQDHDGENPEMETRGSTRSKRNLAFRGLMREAEEQERMEELGYRGDNHEVEEVLMMEWLLKIREIHALPDRPNQVRSDDNDIGVTQ